MAGGITCSARVLKPPAPLTDHSGVSAPLRVLAAGMAGRMGVDKAGAGQNKLF